MIILVFLEHPPSFGHLSSRTKTYLPVPKIKMLFLVEWSVKSEYRIPGWNAFGNMTQQDHRDTEGNVKLIGRYHKIAGYGGKCIVESDNSKDIMTWAMHWSHISDVKVQPVLEDVDATECVQKAMVFKKKEDEVQEEESDQKEEDPDTGSNPKMLFIVKFSIKCENRVTVWNAFGNMTQDDHRKTEGNVKLISRYHKLAGDGGLCIVESESAKDIMAWAINWSHLGDMEVEPVLEDAGKKECIEKSSFFVKKE